MCWTGGRRDMDSETRRKLESIGVDVEYTLERFMGNEALYLKFVAKIGEDPTMKELCSCMEQREMQKAYRCAHTLKGLASNLGLSDLQRAAENLAGILRDLPEENRMAIEAYRQLDQIMKKVIGVTQTL